ncbi:MAG: class I SAM-dependent methyltransferase [Acidobacteria bacterium]|nr:class I SAM-dependent methyltransferase [Acidobacteriota bacterium]
MPASPTEVTAAAGAAAAGAAAAGAAASGGGPPPCASGAAAGALDKSSRTIRDMFGAVARRYDLLNHLLSGGLDLWWRRRAAAALELPPGPPGALVLDLCAGTGDQAVALSRHGARVAAADFCLPMLALARRKFRRHQRRRRGHPPDSRRRRGPRRPHDRGDRHQARHAKPGGAAPPPRPLAADALALPFPPARFAAATVAFGLRNVADLDRALRELAAALAPGGRLAVLEFAVPAAAPLRALYLLYFRRVLPLIGRLLSDSSSAYEYLPSSVLGFPQRRAFLERMAAAGFADLACQDLAAGIVCLYRGSIPLAPASAAARLASISPLSPSPISPGASASPSSIAPGAPVSPSATSPLAPISPIAPISQGRSDS